MNVAGIWHGPSDPRQQGVPPAMSAASSPCPEGGLLAINEVHPPCPEGGLLAIKYKAFEQTKRLTPVRGLTRVPTLNLWAQ